MRTLRVLQVAPRLAPFVGGIETHVREVGRRLIERGVDTTLLTADPTGRLPARDQLDGAPVIRVKAWPRQRDWLFAPGIARHVARGPWDVIHVQGYHTLVAPLAMAAAARAGRPYVLTFHGGGNSSRLRNAARGTQVRLLRPLLVRARALAPTAEFEIGHYGRLAGLSPSRFVTIHSGAEPAQASLDGTPARNGTLLVSSGRLERYKGHDRVIRAFPHVLARLPDARLWIAGEGPDEARLQALADDLGIADRVEIEVSRDRSAFASRLQSASLVLLLSDFETWPLAALEAAGVGVPALVADNSGMAELAAKGLARAVSLDASPQEHAEAMVQQIRAPIGGQTVALPTWGECADALLELYLQVAPTA